MAGLRPPHVPESPVPVFAAGDLRGLERACTGRSFQQRRDAAVIAVIAVFAACPRSCNNVSAHRVTEPGLQADSPHTCSWPAACDRPGGDRGAFGAHVRVVGPPSSVECPIDVPERSIARIEFHNRRCENFLYGFKAAQRGRSAGLYRRSAGAKGKTMGR
jgi:hypothetical protein